MGTWKHKIFIEYALHQISENLFEDDNSGALIQAQADTWDHILWSDIGFHLFSTSLFMVFP